MVEDLPKQELLIKLLKMSTSPNEGEVVVAMRKANALLTSAGWDWDKLINGKIVVVADPFSSIPTPPSGSTARHAPPPMRPAPAPPPPQTWARPTPPPPPRPASPPPPPRKPVPYSDKPNRYAGFCYCCGTYEQVDKGFIFNPSQHNGRAPDKSVLICAPCNKSRPSIMRSYAPRYKGGPGATPASAPAPNLSDL
jgi:hypothetical protein